MASLQVLRRQFFSPSCPSGGQWYACTTGPKFVGCCRSDPCQLDCPDGNLMPASFDANYYGKFPDLECPSGAQFYTCTLTSPAPFMGCCKTNPCSDGKVCSGSNLTRSHLSGDIAKDSYYVPSLSSSSLSTSSTSAASKSTSSTATTTPSTASTSSLSSPLSSFTPIPISSPTPQVQPKSSSNGAVIGGAVGGSAFFLALVGLLLFFFWRRIKALLTASHPQSRAEINQEYYSHYPDPKDSASHYQDFQSSAPSYHTTEMTPVHPKPYHSPGSPQTPTNPHHISVDSNGNSMVPTYNTSRYVAYRPQNESDYRGRYPMSADGMEPGLGLGRIGESEVQVPVEMPDTEVYQMDGEHAQRMNR